MRWVLAWWGVQKEIYRFKETWWEIDGTHQRESIGRERSIDLSSFGSGETKTSPSFFPSSSSYYYILFGLWFCLTNTPIKWQENSALCLMASNLQCSCVHLWLDLNFREAKAHSWLLLVERRRRKRSLQQKQIATTLKEKHIATIVLIHQNAFHLVSSYSSYLTIS